MEPPDDIRTLHAPLPLHFTSDPAIPLSSSILSSKSCVVAHSSMRCLAGQPTHELMNSSRLTSLSVAPWHLWLEWTSLHIDMPTPGMHIASTFIEGPFVVTEAIGLGVGGQVGLKRLRFVLGLP